MQASFHCHWCQARKPLSCGFKQMGPRRRKCLQCHANTKEAQREPPQGK